VNLGAVGQILRLWIGRSAAALPLFPKLEPTSPDRLPVESQYRRMAKSLQHAFLE